MKTSSKINIAKLISRLLIFFLKKKNICIKRNGLNWNLDLNEAIDLSIYLTGRFEPSIFYIIKTLSENKNYDYIDIGANNGAHSLYLAQKFTKSKIYAIEPTDYSFNKLLKNIELNPRIKKQIIPIQSFVTSKENKPESVYTSWELNSGEKKHSEHLGVKKSVVNCTLISLDSLVEKNKIEKSIIKCDVDGNELFVFESGVNFLSKFKPKIIMEQLLIYILRIVINHLNYLIFLNNLVINTLRYLQKKKFVIFRIFQMQYRRDLVKIYFLFK